MSGAMPAERMAADLGLSPDDGQWYETNALDGTGVVEALTAIAARVVVQLSAAADGSSRT